MASQLVPAGSQQKLIDAQVAESISFQAAQALVAATTMTELTVTMEAVAALLHEFSHVIDSISEGRWVSSDGAWTCGRCGYRYGMGRTDQEWADRINQVTIPK
jgi:hypothetical protein